MIMFQQRIKSDGPKMMGAQREAATKIQKKMQNHFILYLDRKIFDKKEQNYDIMQF